MSVEQIQQHLDELPLVAILRGVRPEEVVGIASAIYDAGFRAIEVPLNSPEPFDSIRKLAVHFGDKAAVGAGTVLTLEDAMRVRDSGGQLIVSPNMNPKVVSYARENGMYSFPGVMTCTECFAALDAGANALKLFPASVLGFAGLNAIRAVLPRNTHVYVVGGVDATNLEAWSKAGATGMGLGSCLYRAGDSIDAVAKNAKTIVAAYRM